MISGIETTRANLAAGVIAPTNNVKVYKLLPGWESVSEEASGILEQPDLIGGSVMTGASGSFSAVYSGWKHIPCGDSTNTGTYIYRVIAPKVYDATSATLYLHRASVSNIDEDPWTTHLHSITPTGSNVQKAKTRGGLVATNATSASYWYIRADGKLAETTINDAAFTGVYFNYGATIFASVVSACVAPIASDCIYICYLKASDRNVYLARWNGASYDIQDRIIGQCTDETPWWGTILWFDAERYNNSEYLVANFSLLGSSRGFWVYGSVVSEPLTILPFDDMDWTGLFKVASLSVINNRLYAVAWQKFAAGVGYSVPLISCLWTNDGIHWAQPGHLAVTTEPVAGKLHALGDYVVLVGNRVLRGIRTLDFGGNSSASEVDITSAVIETSLSRWPNSASELNLRLNPVNVALLQAEGDWLPYMGQIGYKVGTSESDMATIGTFWIDGPERHLSFDENSMSMTALGSYSLLTTNTQFTDEIIDAASQSRFDMWQNAMISRAGSVWTARNGILYTDLPNEVNESIAVSSTPLKGGFEFRARLTYDAQAIAFGLVLWMGVEQKDPYDEYGDHNFYYLYLKNMRNGTVQPEFRRRTGVKNDAGVWVESDVLLNTPDAITWASGTWYTFKMQYQSGKLFGWFWNHSVWTKFIEWTPTTFLPTRALFGLYAKTVEARATASAVKDDTTVVVNDATDWPASGAVLIYGKKYPYVLSGTTMTLGHGLQDYVSEGTVLTLVNSGSRCDWLAISSANLRFSVADVCRRLCMRSGINLSVDSLVGAMSNFAIVSGAPTYNSGTWVFGSAGLLTTGVNVSSYVAELRFSGLNTNGDYIEFDVFDAKARLKMEGGLLTISVLRGGVSLGSSPTWATASSGWLRVVASDGWFHFYLNRNYLGSHFDTKLKPSVSRLNIGGVGTTLHEVNVDVGCEVIAMGIWDANSTARDVIDRITTGRNLLVIEQANQTLRLESSLQHDHLGVSPTNRKVDFGYGRVLQDSASALMVQGGYDWEVFIDEKLLKAMGLRWARVENHSLLNAGEVRAFAAGEARRQRAALRTYRFSGRPDIAMMPNDSFTIAAYGGHSERSYVVDSMELRFMVDPGKGPLFAATVQGVGMPSAPDATTYGTDDWNEGKEWK